MATYIIGDVHGCLDSLQRLLAEIEFDAGSDRVLLTGDLVNGGPESAGVVRWARRHQAGVVLGNHDLHLLAVAAGERPPRRNDTFYDLLEAEDSRELLDWLRNRPLLIREEKFLLVHAGLLPEWDVSTALRLAGEAEEAIRARGDESAFFRGMYGDEPGRWDDGLEGIDRLRVIINAMTRMRMVQKDGAIDAEFKGPLRNAPPGLLPWFAVSGRAAGETRVVFGHWAALGLYRDEKVIGLDSGCVWGGHLTAWRLEDERVFQVESEFKDKMDSR